MCKNRDAESYTANLHSTETHARETRNLQHSTAFSSSSQLAHEQAKTKQNTVPKIPQLFSADWDPPGHHSTRSLSNIEQEIAASSTSANPRLWLQTVATQMILVPKSIKELKWQSRRSSIWWRFEGWRHETFGEVEPRNPIEWSQLIVLAASVVIDTWVKAVTGAFAPVLEPAVNILSNCWELWSTC